MIKLLLLLVVLLPINAVHSAKASVFDNMIKICNELGQTSFMAFISWIDESVLVSEYHEKGHHFHGEDAVDDTIIADMTLHLMKGITDNRTNLYLLNNRFSRRLKSEKMLKIEYEIITGDKCKNRNINDNCYKYEKQPSGSSYLKISLVWSNQFAIIHNPFIQTVIMDKNIKAWVHNEKSILITIDLSNATDCSWWEIKQFMSQDWKNFSMPKIYQGLLHVTTMLPSLVKGDTAVVPAQLGYSTVSCNIPQYNRKSHDGLETMKTSTSKAISAMMNLVKFGFVFLLFYFNAAKISDKVAEYSNPANRLNNHWLLHWRSDIFWGSVYFITFNIFFTAIAIDSNKVVCLFFVIGLIPAIRSVRYNDNIHGVPSILYPGFQWRWIRAWQVIKFMVIELFIVIILAWSAVAWDYIIPFLMDPVDVFFELYEIIIARIIEWISCFILSYLATSLYWNRDLSLRENIPYNIIAMISNFVVTGTIAYSCFHEILLTEIASVDNRFRNVWVNDDPFEYFLAFIGLCFSFYVTNILKRLTFPKAENQPQNNPIVPANAPAQQAIPPNYPGFAKFIWSLGTLLCTLITLHGICGLVVIYIIYQTALENSSSDAESLPHNEL